MTRHSNLFFPFILAIILWQSTSIPIQKKPSSYVKVEDSKSASQKKLSLELENLIADARLLPAEFHSDVFLKLINSQVIKDKGLQKDLLEEVLLVADKAQNKIKKTIMLVSSESVDTRHSYSSNGYNLNLDTASLRVRVIQEIVKLDKSRALQLINLESAEIPLEALSCDDLLVYDVSAFYALLADVAKSSFNEKEITQGDRIYLLSRFVRGMISPSQIIPVARMIFSSQLTNDELAILAPIYSKQLAKIEFDEQSFMYFLGYSGGLREIFSLVRETKKTQILTDDFFSSIRNYLNDSLAKCKCAKNINSSSMEILKRTVTELNQSVFKIQPISLVFLPPAKQQSMVKTSEYFTEGKGGELYKVFIDLRENVLERNLDQVTERVEKLLTEIGKWHESANEDELDVFNQKILIYKGLLRLDIPRELKEKVSKNGISLLENSGVYESHRAQWLQFTNHFTKLEDPQQSASLRKLLIASNNPALKVYAKLETLLEKNSGYVDSFR